MWIVNIALKRPYTFIVLALLILIISPLVILRTPTDIFPEINIPVVSVLWNYTGLNAEEMEQRITSASERNITLAVNDIDHIESQTLEGKAVIKVFFHPNTKLPAAFAQVAASTQSAIGSMPPGTLPPLVISYTASNVPILQLALSGNGLSEQQLFDLASNFMRNQLATVYGASVPWPYGGKQRQIMIDLQLPELQSKGLSPADVINAVSTQNLILPGGTSKIGQFEYDVDLNGSTKTVAELNDLPVKAVGSTTLYVRDVAHVRDGFSPQTNIVRRDGKRGALMVVQKVGAVSTLDIVQQVRNALPAIAAQLPPALQIQPLADQAVFVRAAVDGVVREAIIAACLTAVMILLFLGSWRSTLIIAVSIPLSILTSICVLSALGETINIMTLGGLALAVGILVDDATVTIENIERNFEEGKDLHSGIVDGAAQIALPALVSTLCICIVFLPMFFLTGVAKFLFIPLAEAVVFAMIASYILSRTLVPTLAMYLLRTDEHSAAEPGAWNFPARFQRMFERGFEALRVSYRDLASVCIRRRAVFIPGFLGICAAVFLLFPWLGQDFFPETDAGQFKLHVRARTGTRIEETARICDLVRVFSAARHSGESDRIDHRQYRRTLQFGESLLQQLRADWHHGRRYPRVSFRKPSSDLRLCPPVTGTIAPRVSRRRLLFPARRYHQPDSEFRTARAHRCANLRFRHSGQPRVCGQSPAPVEARARYRDLRIHQVFDQPKIHLFVDRTKAAESGFTQQDISRSMLISLSGSFQTQPTFWLDPRNGVNYSLVAQAPQYALTSLGNIDNIPISGSGKYHPEILGDVASTTRGAGMALVSHYNVRRAIDIFGSANDRDLGGVARDINRVIARNRKDLPRGSELFVRGQIETMQSSFQGLLGGLALAIVLVYLLIVVNFQSWLDPFIIITALPAALAGIVMILFITRTTVSVPALMGAIMSVGVATANSILVVSFAKEHLADWGDPVEAALAAGFARFRPVLMTALAMIIGMIPMALGFGEGGEQNAPLGRAVIGGLIFATVATLFFVPAVFSILHGRRPAADVG